MINPVQRLYDEVFHFVSSDDGLHGGGEALDDRGVGGDSDGIPGGGRVRVLSPGSADLVNKRQASTTLERLWLRSRRLVMRSEDRSAATVEIMLMVLEGRS